MLSSFYPLTPPPADRHLITWVEEATTLIPFTAYSYFGKKMCNYKHFFINLFSDQRFKITIRYYKSEFPVFTYYLLLNERLCGRYIGKNSTQFVITCFANKTIFFNRLHSSVLWKLLTLSRGEYYSKFAIHSLFCFQTMCLSKLLSIEFLKGFKHILLLFNSSLINQPFLENGSNQLLWDYLKISIYPLDTSSCF